MAAVITKVEEYNTLERWYPIASQVALLCCLGSCLGLTDYTEDKRMIERDTKAFREGGKWYRVTVKADNVQDDAVALAFWLREMYEKYSELEFWLIMHDKIDSRTRWYEIATTPKDYKLDASRMVAYCKECGVFVPLRDVGENCPKCGRPFRYGWM